MLLNPISGCFLFAFGACLGPLLGAILKVSGWYVALGQLPPGVNTGCLVMFLMFVFARGPGINKVLAQYQSTINTVKAWCAFLKVSA